MLGQIRVQTSNLSVVPDFCHRVKFSRDVFLDGGLWLIFPNEKWYCIILDVEEDKNLVFPTTSNRGFSHHGPDIHHGVGSPFGTSPHSNKNSCPLDFRREACFKSRGRILAVLVEVMVYIRVLNRVISSLLDGLES